MEKAQRLENMLSALADLLDPYEVGEAIVLRLQNDTGMRLLDSLSADKVREAFLNGLTRDSDGTPMYEATVGGITIQWPSRRIGLGHGRTEYI